MQTFKQHFDILPPAQQKLWRELQPALGLGFGKTFQPSESIKALTYFEDGDLNTLTSFEKKS